MYFDSQKYPFYFTVLVESLEISGTPRALHFHALVVSELLEILTRRLLQSVPYTHHGRGRAGIHLDSELLATRFLTDPV